MLYTDLNFSEQGQDRPFFFVCHILGGIVVNKVVCSPSWYPQILRCLGLHFSAWKGCTLQRHLEKLHRDHFLGHTSSRVQTYNMGIYPGELGERYCLVIDAEGFTWWPQSEVTSLKGHLSFICSKSHRSKPRVILRNDVVFRNIILVSIGFDNPSRLCCWRKLSCGQGLSHNGGP